MRDGPGAVGERIADALRAACGPRSVSPALHGALVAAAEGPPTPALPPGPPVARRRSGAGTTGGAATLDGVDDLVVELFREQGTSLVRLARLFVDDRTAAEDLVQEAFIRLARTTDRIRDRERAPAYLRSIVLNLARDHNRRGLVSLRHHLPSDPTPASTEDRVVLSEDRQRVVDALRELSLRQRSCLVLRYYEQLGVDEIADVLGISRNSVKTHLSRGLQAMEARL